MGNHIQSFKEHSTNEKLGISDNESTKFNKLTQKEKIKYLVDNFGMEKVEAEEICPNVNTKVSDLPKEIKSYFKK